MLEALPEAATLDGELVVMRGGEVAPGIARVKPPGTLSVRPDKNAGDAIERMVAAGILTWDGTPAALPPAAETEAVQA